MSEDATKRMLADKGLTDDINKVSNFQELQTILHNAVERSPELGLRRDENTGQFIKREPTEQDTATKAAAAKAAADAAPRTFEKKGVAIGGQKFNFSAPTELELARQIASANEVAAALASDAAVTPRSVRAAAARKAEQVVLDKVDADMALRRGEISTAEYLERTGAVAEFLAAQGVDVEKLAQDQANKAWSDATTTFLNSDAGSSWPGGNRNRQLLGDKLSALGLLDVEDKVAAMAQAYAALKKAGTLFDGDVTPDQLNAMTADATPAELVQAWKESVQKDVHGGDATQANEAFIKIHNGGSGIFNR